MRHDCKILIGMMEDDTVQEITFKKLKDEGKFEVWVNHGVYTSRHLMSKDENGETTLTSIEKDA